MSAPGRAVALELDGALADTRPLWHSWLEAVAEVVGVRPEELPADRADAADELDARGAGNWRDLLERYAEERVAVYVRRDATTGEALRALAARGVAVGVFSDGPEPLARVVLEHLGAARRVAALEAGRGALDRLLARLGPQAAVLRTKEELRAEAVVASS